MVFKGVDVSFNYLADNEDFFSIYFFCQNRFDFGIKLLKFGIAKLADTLQNPINICYSRY